MGSIRATDAERGSIGSRLRDVFFGLSPSAGGTLPVLDGVRALAVLAIFARHSWGLTGQVQVVVPVPGGDVDLTPLVVMLSNGVDLFFVLSGFLLARSFIEADLLGRPAPSLRTYVRARGFRILPAYWVVLAALLLFFTPTVVHPELVYSAAGLRSILSHVVLLQTVFPWSYGLWGPASPFWTLTIEIIFYLSVPWLARAFFRNRWVVAVPACAAVTFGWMWFARSGLASPLVDLIVDHGAREGSSEGFARFFLSKQFPGHLFDFSIGMAVANWWVHAKHHRKTLPVRVLETTAGSVAALVAGVAIVLVSMRELGRLTLTRTFYDGLQLVGASDRDALLFYYFEEPSMAVGFGLVIAALVLGPPWPRRPLSIMPLRLVGILGYSIYLWHMPFLYMHTELPWLPQSPGRRWLAMGAFSGAVVLLVSALTFVFVERPFIAMGKRRPPAGPDAPKGAAAAPVELADEEPRRLRDPQPTAI